MASVCSRGWAQAGSAIRPSIRASLTSDSLARGRVIESLSWTRKPAPSLCLSCQISRSRKKNSLDWRTRSATAEDIEGAKEIIEEDAAEWMDKTLETPTLNEKQRWTIVKKKLGGLMSNAEKQSKGVNHNRHSLGVDLGDSRTGVAVTLKGYAPRPLSVLQLKGDKLIENLLQIASKERADEFIVGLPISFDGKETAQSKKTRSFTGKLAAQAAQRGLRVYLLDEYGSSQDGLDYMLDMGMKKKSRKEKLDAYAAVVLLHSYFSGKGAYVKILVPKGLVLQERLCLGDDFITDESNMEDDF